jgi:hypothetical protein
VGRERLLGSYSDERFALARPYKESESAMSLREKIEYAFISHVDSNGYSGVWPEVISSLADIAAVCATDEVADLQERVDEQKLTIQALMSGMPEGSTTTPVIRQIGDLQARLEAAESALLDAYSAFRCTQICSDYPPSHWSHKAAALSKKESKT